MEGWVDLGALITPQNQTCDHLIKSPLRYQDIQKWTAARKRWVLSAVMKRRGSSDFYQLSAGNWLHVQGLATENVWQPRWSAAQ